MSEIDELYQTLKPGLRGVSAKAFGAALDGLEPAFAARRRRRTRLAIRRLRFRGAKCGDFRFHPGVNVLRAGNDKGKSSILKLIHFCLTGKNELKKDVDDWIDEVELEIEIDGLPHVIAVDKRGRPKGQLVEGGLEDELDGTLDGVPAVEPLLAWQSAKEMQEKLEGFMNEVFGLRPLMGTQKDSRKGSDALLDSLTSYRAYFRGLYVNQDLGYTTLLTDGLAYGNHFMKVLGMLLGIDGIEAFFAVDARRAHLENALGKEERYHRRLESRRLEATPDRRDLATLDEDLGKLELYIDELKTERTRLLVQATSDDADKRLGALSDRLLKLDDAREGAARRLRASEDELEAARREIAELETALASRRALSPIQPEKCPVCTRALAERRRFPEPRAGSCLLCHEDLPAAEHTGDTTGDGTGDTDFEALAEKRLAAARDGLEALGRQVGARRAVLEETEVRLEKLRRQKRNLQSQLRSAFQGVAEIEREIELETRYLGRLEAERENAARIASEGDGSGMEKLLRDKQILDAVTRHLRTAAATKNERTKRAFTDRILEHCTAMGFPGLEDVHLDARLEPRIVQNGKTYRFDELSPGEKVRFVLAFYLALATGGKESGLHPGLLLIDSPGKEEMVDKDFAVVVELLREIEDRYRDEIQILVASSIPAISGATDPEKQIYVAADDTPLFG